MLKQVFVIEGEAKTWEEAISLTSTMLLENRCVKETFLKSCIKREIAFPTGLPTQVPVAIPHTDPAHVNQNAVCVLRLKNSVMFKNMEDPDKDIPVNLVFNMAITDSNHQLVMLKEIIDVMQDAEFLTKAKKMPLEELKAHLKRKWIEKHGESYAYN